LEVPTSTFSLVESPITFSIDTQQDRFSFI
jgi:hypothetical protein